MNDVSLTIGGNAYRGWIGVQITRSLEDAAASFELTGTLGGPVAPDAAVQVRIGDDLVLTGHVDALRYSPGSRVVTVSGRSATADLVDCHAAPGQYRGLTLLQFAEALAAPYGVRVVTDVTAFARPVPPRTVRRGATVYQEIEWAARAAGLLVTDDERGRLVLARAGDARSATALVVGENVLSGGEIAYDSSGRYTEYRVRSQTAGNDQAFGEAVASIDGYAEDAGLTRTRVLYVDAPGLSRADAERRAQWEAATRAGQSLTANLSVVGWRQGDGTLWRPGQRTRVADRESGLDGELIIRTVVFAASAEGMTTTMDLVPALTYLVEPVRTRSPVPGRRAGGAWGELEGGV